MNQTTCSWVAALLVLLPSIASAQDAPKKFEITPVLQKQLDAWKAQAAKWAADPEITTAVAEQNGKGPIAGMDEKKWKGLKRRSADVEAFQKNPAGKSLAAFAATTHGIVSELFLSAQKGEKVAFLEKTTSYVHAGRPKFDVPFTKATAWQGEPEFDESTQTYALQIAVPVFDPKDAKQPIGVLVVGINITQLVKAPAAAPIK